MPDNQFSDEELDGLIAPSPGDRRIPSLRKRYLIATTLITILLYGGALLTQLYVSSRSETSITNLEHRNKAAHAIHALLNAVISTEMQLDAFMLSPNTELRDKVHDATEHTYQAHNRLSKSDWFNTASQQKLTAIGHDLSQLRKDVLRLMEKRENLVEHFPIIRILGQTGQESYLQFNTAAMLAIESLGNSDEFEAQRKIQVLQAVYSDWLEMMVDFRHYIINLLGKFYEHNLPLQAHELELRYSALHDKLTALHKNSNAFDLDIAVSLEQMLKATERWYQSLERINALGQLGYDSSALPFMQNTIEPQFSHIFNSLKQLENSIESSFEEDVSALSSIAKNTVNALLILSSIGLVLVITGYLYFERAILLPITLVANALRAEATGGPVSKLPRYNIGEIQNLTDAFFDMRQQIHERQDALEHQALHDALTGLPNRLLLRDRMEQAINFAQRDNGNFALLLLDLDRFKEINDSLGHYTGDLLLQAFSKRIRPLLRQSDTIARLGGDEFAILLAGSTSHQAYPIAQKLLDNLETPFLIQDNVLYLSCSIGISQYPKHATEPEEISRMADVAMYEAKKNHARIAVYNVSFDKHNLRRLSLANELKHAINENQLSLAYQPQVDVGLREFCGLEVLLRWHHPHFGPVRPDEFIQIAENSGLIGSLTEWVIENTMKQCRTWKEKNICYGTVAINLSMYNLQDPDFPGLLSRMLEKWELGPSDIALEITESAMLADIESAQKTLQRFDEMGIEIAVDDYGTGFSSLAYLKKLPIRKLKIDKSFVTDMTTDDNDAVIVRSTIDMAHNLGFMVVAEGVEKAETLNLLDILDCDIAQGYWVSKPMPIDELEAWLDEQKNIRYLYKNRASQQHAERPTKSSKENKL